MNTLLPALIVIVLTSAIIVGSVAIWKTVYKKEERDITKLPLHKLTDHELVELAGRIRCPYPLNKS